MNNKKRVITIAVILVVAVLALVLAFALPKKSNDEKAEKNIATEVAENNKENEAPEQNAQAGETAGDSNEKADNTQKEASDTQATTEGAATEEATTASDVNNIVFYIVADGEVANAEAMMQPIKEEFAGKAQIEVRSIEDETMKMMGFALPDELPKLLVIPQDGQFAQVPNCTDVEVIKQELAKISG